ncbi:ribbon-helix-helix protein, CopG family [Actinopolyspora halophila]|uniref:ribbon-helix-helix protein, CopG family n=1 Tax=Actinopolyspora halophila TaxID=1850 RepID=UPI0003758E93|nr:ribbon-helix-helix protein, CopG family [Actinopolyspora halophila]
MTKTEDNRANRRARHAAIRAEVAAEEAENAEAESAENATTLDVPLHLRIDQQLDAQLREWAATEHIPTSALVRRLLRQAMQEHRGDFPTTTQVEEIARRVAREELHHS